MSAEAAGADICSAEAFTLAPSERRLVPTGFALFLARGYEAQIRPRSGLSLKHGVVAILGTIDADYRGEVGVVLANVGTTPFRVERGDRVAQMIIAPVTRGDFYAIHDLPVTGRGAAGFGSTGMATANASRAESVA